eukprot:5997704-Lingulodinium_polyedra.AAC.1
MVHPAGAGNPGTTGREKARPARAAQRHGSLDAWPNKDNGVRAHARNWGRNGHNRRRQTTRQEQHRIRALAQDIHAKTNTNNAHTQTAMRKGRVQRRHTRGRFNGRRAGEGNRGRTV